MVDGEATPAERRLRSAAPEWAGPLGSSGAAPEGTFDKQAAEPRTPDPAAAAAPTAQPDRPATKPERPADPPATEPAETTADADAPKPARSAPAAGTATPAANAPGTGTATPAASAPAAGTATPAASAPAAGGKSGEIGAGEKPAAGAPAMVGAAGDQGGKDGSAGPGSKDGTGGGAGAGSKVIEVEVAPAGAPDTAIDVVSHGRPSRLRRYSRQALSGPGRAARATREWSRRPAGRLVLPGALLLALVAATVVAGGVLVPATAPTGASGAASPSATATGSLAPDAAGVIGPGELSPTSPGASPTATSALGGGTNGTGTSGRPADVLATWATQTSTKLSIPWVALQAYGYAELVLARTHPACGLKWTTLAAIGKVESNHGGHNATLGTDGRSIPSILGPPLNGTGGTQRITDTDQGELDGDPTYDRAVGPMQFIPTTWRLHAIDADNDSAKDPNDIDDAALAAGNYLCQGGRDLSTGQDWWTAILSYNQVQPYAQQVFETANDYGARSRT
ncbi:lytic murein transglycosylase [Actinomycetes bacterium KLBMP 9797]